MQIDLITPEKVSGAEFIAKIRGEKLAPPRSHYVIDGREYWSVFFGLAFPTDKPGAAVTVGAIREIDKPKLHVRDVVTARDIPALFNRVNGLREQYFIKGGRLGEIVYGQYGVHPELLVEFNKPFYSRYAPKEDYFKALVIGCPEGEETPESGLKYFTSIMSLQTKGKERLFFSDGCEALSSAIVSDAGSVKGRAIYDYNPLVMALGFAVRAMLIQEPWLSPMPVQVKKRDRHAWGRGQEWWQESRAKQRNKFGFLMNGGKVI